MKITSTTPVNFYYGTSVSQRKLTAGERKTLAILMDRLPQCDRGKYKFRDEAALLADHTNLVRWTEGKTGWEITAIGRLHAAKATRSCVWAKWAESYEEGGAIRMVHALNSGGCDAGHALLEEYRL